MKSNKQQRSVPPYSVWWYVSLVSTIGLSVALPMVGGGLIGRWIDKAMGIAPWGTVTLLAVGTVISIYTFTAVIRKVMIR